MTGQEEMAHHGKVLESGRRAISLVVDGTDRIMLRVEPCRLHYWHWNPAVSVPGDDRGGWWLYWQSCSGGWPQ